ncbi:MAG: hypothetical protein EXR10_06975 [Alphaproteobacteria bacterium]|nr:hypothetical protein [Alphaproteobacteria bacterium]
MTQKTTEGVRIIKELVFGNDNHRESEVFKQMKKVEKGEGRTMVVGNYIVAEEKDSFDTPQGRKTQITLGVYEFKDGKISKAWAFPVKSDT